MRGSSQKWGGVFLILWGGNLLPKWLQGSERPLPKIGVMAVRDAPKLAPEEVWACPQNAWETPPPKVFWRAVKDPRPKMAAGLLKMGKDPAPKWLKGPPKIGSDPCPKRGLAPNAGCGRRGRGACWEL